MLWNEDTKIQGYRWIEVLSIFVTAYNKAPHQAHNKSPYEAFFGFKMRGVYSTPGEANTETQEDHVGVDDTIAEATQEKDQEEDNEQVKVTQEEKNNDYEIHMMQVERVRREIGQNDKQYRNKMAIRASVHRRKLAFEPGNKVAIASDHDTNQKTRKRKL